MQSNPKTSAATSQGRLVKGEGSYYTPENVAETICDIAGYSPTSSKFFESHVIDPAAGDGAILKVAVHRYCKAALDKGLTKNDIAQKIAKLFHAYELDSAELRKCQNNVVSTASAFDVPLTTDMLVNFHVGDAFNLYKRNVGSFEFVLGNPPYVRIHNLEEKPDSRYVEGMCDLYYPFFDIAQQLLANNGTMCFIAPSSWFTARAGKKMRADLFSRKAIKAVCDFGHYQVFAPYATAYTAIVALTKNPNDTLEIYPAAQITGEVGTSSAASQKDCWTKGLFLPSAPTWMEEALAAQGDIRVANGYATNLDSMFISKQRRFVRSTLELPVIKASRCEKHWMIYPYRQDGSLMSFEEIRRTDPSIANMLENNKDTLLKRTQVKEEIWWCFGRSQGIADTFQNKIAVQSLVKPGEEVRCMPAPIGCGVYGGVYVIGMTESQVHEAVNSPEFFQYASALRKYKSGGYYAVGGKDLEKFLNWSISREKQ